LSVAAIAGFEVDLKPFEYGVTNKLPEFIDKFTLGKVPAFEGNDGFTLLEGASIARYGQCLGLREPLYRTILTVH
jgi:elongation factor 1-gamma